MSEVSRRWIPWDRFRKPEPAAALAIATALGAGLLPLAPGTWGTLAAIPLAYLTADQPWELRVLLWTGLFLLGTWASKRIAEITGIADHQSIVMDEVVGLGITAWTAGTNPRALIAAFLLFRLFDMVKPPPIRQLDRWSKKQASHSGSSAAWWCGFGVMADDLLAGFVGLAVMLALQYWRVF